MKKSNPDQGIESARQSFSRSVERSRKLYPTTQKQLTRLRFLVVDMLARADGNLDFMPHIREAGYLAVSVGYDQPPIQLFTYEADGQNSVLPPTPTWPQREPMPWGTFALKRPDIVYAFVYRLNGPTGGPGVDILTSTITRDGKTTDASLDGQTLHEQISARLKLWLRDLDFKLELGISANNRKPAKKTPSGKPELPRKISNREKQAGDLLAKGFTQKQISSEMGIGKSAVSQLLKAFDKKSELIAEQFSSRSVNLGGAHSLLGNDSPK